MDHAEVLRDETTVGHHDETVVRAAAGQFARREELEVGCQSVRVIAEDDI
jgi:hypothetical protein